MNNTRLQRILTSGSLVTQAFGFSTLGSLMTLRGWSDSGARIAGLLAVLTGTMFLVAAIAFWCVCRRRTGERLGVPRDVKHPEQRRCTGWPGAATVSTDSPRKVSAQAITDAGRELLPRSENASSNSAAGLVALASVC